MSAVLNLLLTADDYGLNPDINSAVLECVKKGSLTGVSCLVNSPYWDPNVPLESSKRLSLGIHWNLTQGRPVLSPSEVSSLVSTSGDFHDLASLRRRWVLSRLRPSEIEAELTAQLEVFRRTNGEPIFWNTHENVHVFPGLHGLFTRVALRFRIHAMRSRIAFPVSPNGVSMKRYSRMLTRLKQFLIARWDKAAAHSGMVMPEGVIQLLPPLPDENPFSHMEWLGRIGIGRTVELPVHPARTPSSSDFGNIQARRLKEYVSLIDPQFHSRLEREGVRLVSFASLSGERALDGQPRIAEARVDGVHDL